MSKRKWNGGGGGGPSTSREVPEVERLYKSAQQDDSLGGGFMADDDLVAELSAQRLERRQKMGETATLCPSDCERCGRDMCEPSFFWLKFEHPVCDECRRESLATRDKEHALRLMSRTEAKSKYLLKDCDLDDRPPPLRFIFAKNPHNPRYGDMKLYLQAQLVQRAILVHGSIEQIEEARTEREEKKQATMEKRFEKKLKEMRKQMRTADRIDKRDALIGQHHEHRFGDQPEKYDRATDTYSKTCLDCGHQDVYEKL